MVTIGAGRDALALAAADGNLGNSGRIRPSGSRPPEVPGVPSTAAANPQNVRKPGLPSRRGRKASVTFIKQMILVRVVRL
jgi:hypothetical protein